MLTSLCLAAWLTACAAPPRIEVEHVAVEVPGPTKYVPVDPKLVATIEAQTTPEQFTYRQALILWRKDQATIDKLNAQLTEIANLEAPP